MSTPQPSGVQHVVLMKFPEPLTPEDDARLREMVASWPERIGTMSECRLGQDLTGARSQAFQYLLLTVFPELDALASYTAHPVHQELVRFLEDRRCERLAFDYLLDESTDFA